MATKTLNISLPLDLADFLDENPSLSPSKVLQGALQNIQNTLRSNPQLIEANRTIAQQERQNKRQQDELLKHADWLDKEGLWTNYIKDNPE